MPSRTGNETRAGAPRKRARAVVDNDEEEEVLEVASAQASSSRSNQRSKRVRISNDAEPDGEADDDGGDDDAQMSGSDNEDANRPPATQYDTLRDNNFEHLDHEEEDDVISTQRYHGRPQRLGDNAIAENGIIESITCINFMCHERLHVDLGPLLNFIVGENGSGKSAVLTAITLCLGGKASSTNRGGSLKSFVKQGRDQGMLVVKIKNQGIDAYQHDLFGDSIIVERHFSRTGSSGFRLKTATGRQVSNKKKDVNEIVEYYSLQVDNPLNILSQDNARSFLNAASDAEKYRFFHEGVQLHQLDSDYKVAHEFAESCDSKLPEQEERVKLTRKKKQEAIKLREAIKQNKVIRRQRRLHCGQLAWLQVRDQEDILRERENNLEEAQASIREATVVAERSSEAYAAADAHYQRQEEHLSTFDEEATEVERKVQDATQAYQQGKKELERMRGEERDAMGRLDEAKERVRNNNAKIDEEKRLVEGAQGAEVAKKREELEAKNQELADIRQQMTEHNERLPALEAEARNADQELEKSGRMVEAKRRDMQNAQGNLASLEKSGGSPFDGYHPRTPELLRRIASDNGFKEKPIGPIGSTIRVLKPQWSSILESTFGRVLNGFVVFDRPDRDRLSAMMEGLGIRGVPIVVGNNTRIDTSSFEPDAQFDTIMRVLRFENELVKNQLIISHSIEQTILIERRTDAQRVMFDGPAPRNVKACLCFHDTKRGHGLRMTSRMGGDNIATAPVQPSREKPRMKTDMQAQISQQREAVAHLKSDLEAANRQGNELRQAANTCRQALTQHKRVKEQLLKRDRICGAAILKIEQELDSFEGYDERVRQLEETGTTLQEEYETYGAQFAATQEAKAKQSSVVDGLKAKLNEEKLAAKDFDSRLNKAKRAVEMSKDARMLALEKKNKDHEAIEHAKMERDSCTRKLDDQRAHVADFTQEASKIAAERVFIPEGETQQGLQAKIKEAQKAMADREKRVGKTEEEIENDVIATTKAYDEAKEIFKGSQRMLYALHQNLELRLAKFRKFQRLIPSHCRVSFLYLLSERNFKGGLRFDHRARKLQVRVEPDQSRKNAAGRNTKTLSGGEKSFSSICLLLAIWESMGSPLRCLDEFDVFMDNVNRAISTNMLVSAARKSVGRQYIMITPNAIEGRAKLDKDVKIIRMTDPRQRQINGYLEAQ